MIKERLRDYAGLLLEERQLKEQLGVWEAKAQGIAVGKLSGLPRGGGQSDPTALFALEIGALREKLIKKQTEAAAQLGQIECALEVLSPFHRFIMREHYVNGKKWDNIADATNYSVNHIWRLHKEALNKLTMHNSQFTIHNA